MTDIITIPLKQLIAWDGNVRRTGREEGIAELAASIAAHGLLQSLIVRKAPRGKYAVVAGERRRRALMKLVADRTIGKDFPVPCQVREPEAASEISLAENVVRVPMHPADQFEAFRDLIDGGASVIDVAARFGVSEALVAKRLKLGRLSPVILDAYRSGQIGLEEAQAFAITDDRDAQERVFSELSGWRRDPHSIRRALTEDEIPATDPRVRFIGLDAYEDAGGTVRRDLFDDENSGYVQDTELLDRLVMQRLEAEAEALRSQGWSWAEARLELDYDDLSVFTRIYPQEMPLSAGDEAERDRLAQEYDDLAEQAEADPDDEDIARRLEEVDDAIDAIDSAARAFTPEQMQRAGAIVTIDHRGQLDIRLGLVRPGDAATDEPDDDGEPASGNPAPAYSARLVEDLTARRTAFLRVELSRRPDIALATVVHALALQAFYRGAGGHSALDLSLREARLESSISNPGECRGMQALGVERERWTQALPEDPALLWSWCQSASDEKLRSLLAFCAGCAVDAVQRKGDRPESNRLIHADALAQALSLRVRAWFTPGAANLFGRIARPGILTALAEARGKPCPPAWARMKKPELAALAEREIADTGWVPAAMRFNAEPQVEADITELQAAAE